jgi:hypothetical protein
MAYRSKLRDAAELIFTPEGKLNPETWTQGEFARTKEGHRVSPTDARAVKFCALGALERARVGSAAWYCLHAARSRHIVGRSLGEVNDDHPDLLPDIWSEAIEADEALNGGE